MGVIVRVGIGVAFIVDGFLDHEMCFVCVSCGHPCYHHRRKAVVVEVNEFVVGEVGFELAALRVVEHLER